MYWLTMKLEMKRREENKTKHGEQDPRPIDRFFFQLNLTQATQASAHSGMVQLYTAGHSSSCRAEEQPNLPSWLCPARAWAEPYICAVPEWAEAWVAWVKLSWKKKRSMGIGFWWGRHILCRLLWDKMTVICKKTCGVVALFSIPAGIHLLGAKMWIDVESNKIHPKPALWLLVVCEMCPR